MVQEVSRKEKFVFLCVFYTFWCSLLPPHEQQPYNLFKVGPVHTLVFLCTINYLDEIDCCVSSVKMILKRGWWGISQR